MPTESFSRRDAMRLAGLFTAAGAAPLLRSGAARAQAPDAPLRIGYLPITDATPLLVAHNNGLFEAEGIRAEKPTLLRSWAQVIEAFLAGQVDVVHVLSPMAVWARFGSKAPIKVVAWNHMDGSALTVAPEINAVAELGGKTVAVPFWYSIHNVVLGMLLREAGLTPVTRRTGSPAANEVNLVIMAPSDMVPALAAKRIAGYIVAEPFNAAAEAQGVGKVLRFTGDVWRDHACCLVLMNERDLQARPDWSQKVVNAIVRAQVWTRDHRAETAQLLSRDGANRYTPHPLPVLQKVLAPAEADRAAYLASGAIRHADWSNRRIDFQPYPFPSYTEELVRRLKGTLVEGDRSFLEALDPAAAARELVDDRLVRRAIEAVGGPSAFGIPAGWARTETIAV
ncbi:MAG: ABC transporter substrate-binding protein [Roseomonas mucosa]|uniref:ABC transporter substrate-binding protein n=1 Tax=Roseomonas mucosa TaxID=207340 RepID=UPI0028CE1CA0|nr:ABC transporter substrate-binding protein [Roseomonas mucosa]MDT8356779.1 ABC transporter substrate-binding protein [Roseomonas mucosa]MDU7522590.1 ABC transporter substrate-binding protein [Roseomonas mucosa]